MDECHGRFVARHQLVIWSPWLKSLKTVKKKLVEKYVSRLRRIWSSDLNSKYKVQATNVWAVSIFRYFFGILKWTKADLIGLDRTTRRIMRKNKCHKYSAAPEIVPPTKSWRQRPSPVGSLKGA